MDKKEMIEKIRQRHEDRKKCPEARKRRLEIFKKFGRLDEDDLKKRFTI